MILNPAAGRRAGGGLLREFEEAFGPINAPIFPTRSQGHEAKLARDAIDAGYEVIVTAGGDGTCSRVAAEILSTDSKCCLAVVPLGTGNDFAKTLGVSRMGVREIAALVAKGEKSQVDAARADAHYFVNSCGFGFDPAVLEATQSTRYLKGNAVYIVSALGQLFGFRALDVGIRTDLKTRRTNALMVTISNGEYLGGAFRIAPNASVTDGKLDLCVIRDVNVMGRARLFARAFRGTHVNLPSVDTIRITRIVLEFQDPPLMEIDGELHRASSQTVAVECLPRALSVIAAPGFPR